MNDLDRLLAERACERLSYAYAAAADERRHTRLADLFTPDGVFALPDLRLQGRDEIRRFFAGREAMSDLRTLHVLTNIAIDVTSADEGVGTVYLTLHRRRTTDPDRPVPTTSPALVGLYRDRYARVDGTWLFATRTQEVRFVDPEDAPS